MSKINVTAEFEGCRLDKFLANNVDNLSRTKIQKLIITGHVMINENKIINIKQVVHANDHVELMDEDYVEEKPSLDPDASISFKIIYEDNDILVVDKPAGIVVHAGAGNFDHTLVNGLVHHCALSSGSNKYRPGIVHRIDKDTSGILVVAKNDIAHNKLAEQFAIHSIVRKYVCFCFGVISPQNGRIETLITRDRQNRLKMCTSVHSGKKAVTIYRTMQIFGNCISKIECELKTGRTHQIRVHMSSIGHSLVGDKLYKFKNYSVPVQIRDTIMQFPRQALHAQYLEFIHPLSGSRMSFSSSLPNDMTNLENILKKFTTMA